MLYDSLSCTPGFVIIHSHFCSGNGEWLRAKRRTMGMESLLEFIALFVVVGHMRASLVGKHGILFPHAAGVCARKSILA